MKTFKQHIQELEERCWTGYKPVPGKKAFSKGSCKKEGIEYDVEYYEMLDEDNVQHTHIAHYENHNGEWMAKLLIQAKDDQDAIHQATDHAGQGPFKGLKVRKVQKVDTVMEEIDEDDYDTFEQYEKAIEESAAWKRKEGKSPTGGLNAKGIASYRRENPGSKLKKAVTGKVKAGSKAAKRRKSFCARMSGMKGPMKKPNGEPTRKALSLRKWKCR
jgi:hypothetical protein